MIMFKSEQELLDSIAKHDALVRKCVTGELDFWSFCEAYSDFYAFYALDGHESDEEEIALFEKYDNLIEPHRIIAYDILGLVCSDADAQLDSFRQAGRFGSNHALSLLKNVPFNA